MSGSVRKATGSAGMPTRLDPNLISDDTQSPDAIFPADQEVVDVSGEDITSSGTEGQQARKEIQDLFEEFEEPIKNFLERNKERFTAIIAASFETMEQKVEDVLKSQCEERQKLYEDYSLQFLNLVVMCNIDADEVKKHGENLSNMFNEQRKFIHQTLTLQKNRMEEIKSGHSPNLELTCHVARLAVHQVPGVACPTPVVIVQDKLLHLQKKRKLETLRDSQGDSVVEELRHLIATLEIKLLMLNRQQESAAADQSLLDLLFS
ncbi:X-linked lymphocyte-regulated protein 3A-like isoform X2 [Mesocricetus auratus]|uniref:X-linked lymphocyte-regulated protein 3A-like isoform X2 n=1 Tax=Mesocricetus auratus TaxID=10036 RepID=A0ABM2X5W3_MESAU|nr:X-linked lymphocyte-regulated protein 3A-like isoform X2 [Mesocricetus auratus]